MLIHGWVEKPGRQFHWTRTGVRRPTAIDVLGRRQPDAIIWRVAPFLGAATWSDVNCELVMLIVLHHCGDMPPVKLQLCQLHALETEPALLARADTFLTVLGAVATSSIHRIHGRVVQEHLVLHEGEDGPRRLHNEVGMITDFVNVVKRGVVRHIAVAAEGHPVVGHVDLNLARIARIKLGVEIGVRHIGANTVLDLILRTWDNKVELHAYAW
mmetsp:Transcript_5243/g.11745  ORF Transcript_5243/g.11745 Transcript_5243/m.11745 type:complete len:213 (-) Transcript_5243:465-1103(-)